jgi:hypothetical protein
MNTLRHVKLIAVLFLAAMFLILACLVMSVTSCSPVPTTQVQAAATQAPTEAPIIEDGTLYHPYRVDYCPCGVPYDTWSVLTVHGHEQWKLNWLYGPNGEPAYTLHAGDYIWYQDNEYQLSGVDRKHLTMGAVIMGN